MEQLVGIFVFLPVAISLVVLSFNIRREFLYGTKHDVFRRDLFFGKPVHDVSEERNETKRKSGVVHRGTILATWNKKSNSLRLVLAQKKKRPTPRYLTRTWIEGSQLILCTNEQQFKRVLKKTGQKDDLFLDDGALAMTHSFKHNNDSLCIVCMPIYNDMDAADVIGLLVHEAVHVWQYHCEYIGETKPGEEQEAYCVQAITTFLFRDYLRQKGVDDAKAS